LRYSSEGFHSYRFFFFTSGGFSPFFRLFLGSLKSGSISDLSNILTHRFEDRFADEFWDLWDDSVAEGSKAVHPRGNPISHSTHVGFSRPFNSCGVVICLNFAREPLPPHLHIAAPPELLIAVGAGHINLAASASDIPF
jgi:hypothetical protein